MKISVPQEARVVMPFLTCMELFSLRLIGTIPLVRQTPEFQQTMDLTPSAEGLLRLPLHSFVRFKASFHSRDVYQAARCRAHRYHGRLPHKQCVRASRTQSATLLGPRRAPHHGRMMKESRL